MLSYLAFSCEECSLQFKFYINKNNNNNWFFFSLNRIGYVSNTITSYATKRTKQHKMTENEKRRACVSVVRAHRVINLGTSCKAISHESSSKTQQNKSNSVLSNVVNLHIRFLFFSSSSSCVLLSALLPEKNAQTQETGYRIIIIFFRCIITLLLLFF